MPAHSLLGIHNQTDFGQEGLLLRRFSCRMKSNLPTLPFELKTQNSRVLTLNAEKEKIDPSDKISTIEAIIEKCYKQILFSPLQSERDQFLESQLRNGSITIRDFIRGLLLSDYFYQKYVLCNNNERVVKQVIGRALGRYTYSDSEVRSYAVKIAEIGFSNYVDYLLESEEYMNKFGYDRVPSQTNRRITGRATGEIPVYQALPRYGEIWRDTLIKKGLMMSIEEHLNYSSRKIGVNAWIYEKPTGVYYQIWIVSVSIISVLATVGIVNLSNAIFTIR